MRRQPVALIYWIGKKTYTKNFESKDDAFLYASILWEHGVEGYLRGLSDSPRPPEPSPTT